MMASTERRGRHRPGEVGSSRQHSPEVRGQPSRTAPQRLSTTFPADVTTSSRSPCLRWKRTTQAGLVVHESRRLGETEIDSVDGIPVTRPERTILDLASCFPRANFLELVVQAARRKRLVTYESTRAHFEQHARRGLTGVRALREVLERWDPENRATESEMETLLLQALRKHGLPEPRVQYEIRKPSGGDRRQGGCCLPGTPNRDRVRQQAGTL